MAWIYGERIPDVHYGQLLDRLRTSESSEARLAAATLTANASDRSANVQSADLVREAIVDELNGWADLGKESPPLASLRDRLSASRQSSS